MPIRPPTCRPGSRRWPHSADSAAPHCMPNSPRRCTRWCTSSEMTVVVGGSGRSRSSSATNDRTRAHRAGRAFRRRRPDRPRAGQRTVGGGARSMMLALCLILVIIAIGWGVPRPAARDLDRRLVVGCGRAGAPHASEQAADRLHDQLGRDDLGRYRSGRRARSGAGRQRVDDLAHSGPTGGPAAPVALGPSERRSRCREHAPRWPRSCASVRFPPKRWRRRPVITRFSPNRNGCRRSGATYRAPGDLRPSATTDARGWLSWPAPGRSRSIRVHLCRRRWSRLRPACQPTAACSR